ncbi:MAG: alpha/beta hydrolase [Chitinophagaceae bacterium]|nr:alpha/beta hydrolase [Chitinophagaceae bacterium]
MKLFSFFLSIVLTLTLNAQNTALQDSIYQNNLYATSKIEFENYEKQHGKYIETNNVKMHYLTWGNPSNTPLVWVHGTYSNGYELLEIIDSLVKKDLYVIAIDYYGHGFTPIPKKEISIYHVADDIKFLLNKLKIKKTIIGGWSRGGSISTAFYDAYPSSVLGLILEDGGSVAWDVNNHKQQIDTYSKETEEYYKNRKENTYTTEFDAYWLLYNNWGIKGKKDLKLKKEIFTCIARIKKSEENKWLINPGVEVITGEQNAEQDLANIFKPFAAKELFGASTHLLNPKIIYRNLDVPMLIFDPLSKNDWYDFEAENTKLTQTYPLLITHKIYQNTWHGVKDERPVEFLKDVDVFLKKLKEFYKKK